MPDWDLYLLAALVGAVWGLSEIVAGFKNETPRALRTAGAWLLILLNAGASALTFAVVVVVVPETATVLGAFFIALAWPTVIRNTSIKLLQPLQPDAPPNESAAIRLEEAYASFQELARQLINNTLTRQRLKLVEQAMQHDLAALVRHARIALIASPLQENEGMPEDNYIDRILARELDDDVKKAMLAAFILQYFGRETLEEHLHNPAKPHQAQLPPPRKNL